jgi:putative ABC transport system permease protein
VTLHDVIVTLQIATSLAMLISAALLVQTLRSLNSVDPGFRADNLLLASLDPGAAGYDGNRLEGFWRDTLDRVRRIPGVQSASLARIVPLATGRQRQTLTHPTSGERTREIDLNFVGPRYFRTLDIPLLRGREFDERDGRTSRPVVIVNERLARMFWAEENPVGKSLRLPGPGNPAEVVGLVRDVKYQDVRAETGPMFYRPILQTASTDAMTLHVRASSDPGDVIGTIRGEIQTLDPRVPLFNVTTLEDQLNASFGQTRQAAALTGVFGVLALLLSAIGVYSVTALAVARRTRDIGIRMALGAERPDIVRLIARRGVIVVLIGVILGLLGSFAFTQVAEASLYGVTASDSATFAVMAALLAVVSLIGCYIPVRTATRLDAMRAIRYE